MKKSLHFNLALPVAMVVLLSLPILQAAGADGLTLLGPVWVPQDTVLYVPDPDLVSMGQSDIRLAAEHARRATAPRPFGFIFQCNWEEWSVDISAPPYKGWAGREVILEKGYEFFRDPERTRGFGRPPASQEIELQIAYLLGEGVKNFWGYGYPTECCQGLLFHGAIDLPEVWASVTKMAKVLSQVKAEVQLSHPIPWARTKRANVRVSTLVCGRDHALVVAINENYRRRSARLSSATYRQHDLLADSAVGNHSDLPCFQCPTLSLT